MRRWSYWRLHIPTGDRTLDEMDAMDRNELLRHLDAYNRQQPGVWQYWSAS
jgi:hypothetical protein